MKKEEDTNMRWREAVKNPAGWIKKFKLSNMCVYMYINIYTSVHVYTYTHVLEYI